MSGLVEKVARAIDDAACGTDVGEGGWLKWEARAAIRVVLEEAIAAVQPDGSADSADVWGKCYEAGRHDAAEWLERMLAAVDG